MRELIRIVQDHMDQYGVSEAEVARRIGANPQTVNTWRNGEMKQLPRQQYLEGLAELTKTPYPTVLSAALYDTGYVTSAIVEKSDHLATMIELSFLADDVDDAIPSTQLDPSEADADDIQFYVDEVGGLANAAEELTRAVHEAVRDAVGGDLKRLRQIKREIRRFNLAKYERQHSSIPGLAPSGNEPPALADAARKAPRDYEKGRSEQGDAAGDESQDNQADAPGEGSHRT